MPGARRSSTLGPVDGLLISTMRNPSSSILVFVSALQDLTQAGQDLG
jgi:hypothetical protein